MRRSIGFVGVRHLARERAADELAPEAAAGVGADLAVPRLALLGDLEGVARGQRQVEDFAVREVERRARPDVRADAHADRRLVERPLLHAHEHRRGVGALGVGVDGDDGGREQARLHEPLLVVEQQFLGRRRAAPEAGEVAHRRLAVTLQPLDAQLAGAKQRPAVGDDEQLRGAGGDVDLRAGAAPRRAEVAVALQAHERRRLRAAPRVVAKRLAGGQRPLIAQRAQRGLRRHVAAAGERVELALHIDRHAANAHARAGFDAHCHLRHAVGADAGARDRDLRLEVALGLKQ